MTSYLRDTLHKIISSAVHLWFWSAMVDPDRGQKKGHPKPMTLWFYDTHLGVDRELMKGKRVQVTIEIVDDTPAGL